MLPCCVCCSHGGGWARPSDWLAAVLGRPADWNLGPFSGCSQCLGGEGGGRGESWKMCYVEWMHFLERMPLTALPRATVTSLFAFSLVAVIPRDAVVRSSLLARTFDSALVRWFRFGFAVSFTLYLLLLHLSASLPSCWDVSIRPVGGSE